MADEAEKPAGDTPRSKAQEVFERVKAMIADGTKKAEAFRILADEYGQPVNSVRGAYYQATAKHEGRPRAGNGTRRKPSVKPDSVIEKARALIEQAMNGIDEEIELAAARAKEAQAEYEELAASAESRKADLRKQIAALGTS